MAETWRSEVSVLAGVCKVLGACSMSRSRLSDGHIWRSATDTEVTGMQAAATSPSSSIVTCRL